MVTYEWECAPTGQLIAGYANRGTIPADVQLVNSTVGGLLSGPAKYSSTTTSAAAPGASTTAANPNESNAETRRLASAGSAAPAPGKADAAPTNKSTITGGLMGAMNYLQAERVASGVYQHADKYELVFANGAESIRDALITLPGKIKNQRASPMAPAAAVDPTSKDTARQRTDNTVRNFNITAGQQLLQAIDLTIRNSSYIYKQAAVQNSETPDPEKMDKEGVDETSSKNKVPARATLNWYEITMEAIPGPYDYERNDYSYTIRYIVSPYRVQNFNSKFYPIPKFA
jgi:hypothetical protein